MYWGFGFEVWCEGLGLGVWGSGMRVWGGWGWCQLIVRGPHSGCRLLFAAGCVRCRLGYICCRLLRCSGAFLDLCLQVAHLLGCRWSGYHSRAWSRVIPKSMRHIYKPSSASFSRHPASAVACSPSCTCAFKSLTWLRVGDQGLWVLLLSSE